MGPARMKRVLLALAFAAVPAMAFLNHPGKLALARGASAASKPTPSRGVTDSVKLRHRSAPLAFSFPNLKMGLFDFLGATAGKRDYADLKKGSLQEEAAVYAAAREVKAVAKDGHALATFGGGCFWGIELAYARVPGVISTCVGYINGAVEGPSYELVCTGASGHTEAVHLTYDPKVVSYKELCKVLFSRINPSLKDQVGNDRGTQYRHGVYYYNEPRRRRPRRSSARSRPSWAAERRFSPSCVPPKCSTRRRSTISCTSGTRAAVAAAHSRQKRAAPTPSVATANAVTIASARQAWRVLWGHCHANEPPTFSILRPLSRWVSAAGKCLTPVAGRFRGRVNATWGAVFDTVGSPLLYPEHVVSSVFFRILARTMRLKPWC